MAAGLRALGARIVNLGTDIEVTGTGGRPLGGGTVLNAGLSGTTFRFLAAVAVLAKGTVVLDAEAQLRSRPMAPLLEALRAAGAEVVTDEGRPPLHITGHGLGGGLIRIDASASSQFATALLLVAPYADDDLVLEVGGLDELGYVRLTVEAMTRWGASVLEQGPARFKVAAGTPYRARRESVEHDASAAAHLFALAVATGGSITVANAFATGQPDGNIVEVLAKMGARFVRGPSGTTVARQGDLTGVDVNLGAMPDQLPTIAALGALAQGDTVIRGVAIARGHESDRIHAVAIELRCLGARVDETADGLVVHGGAVLHGGRIDTHRDHRIAMAFASIAAVVPGVEIADPGCVAKTYPGFFDDIVRLGLEVR